MAWIYIVLGRIVLELILNLVLLGLIFSFLIGTYLGPRIFIYIVVSILLRDFWFGSYWIGRWTENKNVVFGLYILGLMAWNFIVFGLILLGIIV